MTVRAYQPSFTGGEVAPSLYARTDLTKYSTSLRTCLNFFVMPHGGAATRPGLEFVCEIKDSSKRVRLIPFAFSTTQTYVLEFGNLYMRVIKDGGRVVTAGVAAWLTLTAYAVADLRTESGTTYYCTEAHTSGTFATDLAAGKWSALTGTIYEIPTPYLEADLARLNFTQSADTMYLVHPSYAPRKLTRTGHTSWTLAQVSFAPETSAPTGVSSTPTGTGGTAATMNYKVTAINDETGEESLPSSVSTATGWTESTWPAAAYVATSWTAVTGCTQYKVYKDDNGIYGFLGVTEAVTFKDDNISADVSDTPPGARNPFDATDKYPATASFYEQRLYYGATNASPQTVYGSNINSYNNFNTSRPAGDDEAITFTIASGQVSEVRHIIPLREMILLTSGGEWKVSGNGDLALSPSTIAIKPQSFRGSARVRPLVIGDTIIYLQDKGSIVRDLAYKLESDGFTGTDLSVLSNHLFDGYTITDWSYQQVPYSIVWAVRSDGALLGFTYMREHEVWAWHRHTTDGTFEAVATISEGAEDAAYFVVNRTIGGTTKRFIERLHSRQFTAVSDYFGVDCGLTYDGTAATTISGLDHLEGEEVSIFADGDVLSRQTVVSGDITLPRAYSKVHVGLPYDCDLETLDVDAGAGQGGTIQGRKKSIAKVTLRVLKSRGFRAGPSSDKLLQTKMTITNYDEAIAAYTGDQELVLSPTWNSNGRVFIRQSDPAPLTVLAIMPDIEVGG
jgi:hypothetical protein